MPTVAVARPTKQGDPEALAKQKTATGRALAALGRRAPAALQHA